MTGYHQLLARVSAVRGVRGAMLVAEADGLVIAESSMEGVDGRAVAALAAALAGRLRRTTAAAGLAQPTVIHLRAERGSLLAVPAAEDLLVVAVADRDANLGLARIELLQAAEQVA